jgi:restriction system protein
VARRNNTVEDLMRVTSKLPWRTCIFLGVISAALLHLIASATSPGSVPRTVMPSGLSVTYVHSFIFALASLGQWIVPLSFLFAGLASYHRRSRAITLFEDSREDAHRRIKDMTWVEFERLIGEAYRRRGYAVSERGGSHPDGGIDLVLTQNSQRLLVQCKHWKQRSVGVNVIRELRGVIAAENASGGCVVTSGAFTQEAKRFARSCRVELVDAEGLVALLHDVVPKRDTISTTIEADKFSAPSAESAKCPACGSAMVKCVAKRGRFAGDPFWGCSKFPTCHGIRPLV